MDSVDVSTPTDSATSYDEVPYASFPFVQSHPNRLATVATIFGMQPPPIETARILELGCASGGNIIPMAGELPGSQCVGIDLSSVQVAAGQKMLAEVGFNNVRLEARSITDFGPQDGQFDYVICHGVWSWVPRHVREKILEICDQQLSPQGVAFISYNTYPGWHLRGTVRDMMVYHARKFATPPERVGHARALLDFLVRSVPGEGNAYAMLLKSEMELLRTKSDSYLLHEHLEAVNDPVYFYQFEEQISAHQLQYLGESDMGSMLAETFPSEVDKIIRRLSANMIEMEQYIDFLRNRTFRQTLICHRDVRLDRRPDYRRLKTLRVASRVGPKSTERVDLSPNEKVTFVGGHGHIVASDPGVKAALIVLNEIWPASVPFDRLVELARERGEQESIDTSHESFNERNLGGNLLQCYLRGFVRLHVAPLPCIPRPSERPVTPPVARWYAKTGNYVTNLAHEMVELNDLGRQMLLLADGTRDHQQLTKDLIHLAERGAVVIANPQERAMPAELLVEKTLLMLAVNCLLVA